MTAYLWPILADNAYTGSVLVKHCVGGHARYDTEPAFYVIRQGIELTMIFKVVSDDKLGTPSSLTLIVTK